MVDVYLDHLYIGAMSFSKWDDPEKALSAAYRNFGVISDLADNGENLSVQCKEEENIIHIRSEERE